MLHEKNIFKSGQKKPPTETENSQAKYLYSPKNSVNIDI